ncbi:MAG: hypothetical protein VB083_01090 [Aminobacterium sp.]|uniref:hypothetical protein n=1 Tax=Aminobacterium sp. TaxID=1872491 RepID=UPI002B20CD87|nr:hypothetical protein [Aminobacterium sp.]MEA4876485.1 hypothetical protein [Aminobacterium sp.]
MKQRHVVLILILILGTFVASPLWGMEALARATDILEKWTSFHWGRDCLVWLVHYPEELIEPWVDAESTRVAMSSQEKEAYKKAFVDQLHIEETESFLVTIYSFGVKPLLLHPFSEAISMLLPDGTRIQPLSYELKFDEPINGVVQGLVFFPRQNVPVFSIAMKGMGISDESIFEFAAAKENDRNTETVAVAEQSKKKERVVIELPPLKEGSKEEKKEKEEQKTEKVVKAEIEKIEEPFVPVVPPVKIDLSGYEPLTKEEEEKIDTSSVDTKSLKESALEKSSELGADKEKVLEEFLAHWQKGNVEEMYDLLSTDAKKMWNIGSFKKDVESKNMRVPLSGGYSVEWNGEQARITSVQKLLFVRTLRKMTISMVGEKDGWRVQW